MIPLAASEAAELLEVDRTTISQWARRGWRTDTGERKKLTPVDHSGPRGAARYDWHHIAAADRDIRTVRDRHLCNK